MLKILQNRTRRNDTDVTLNMILLLVKWVLKGVSCKTHPIRMHWSITTERRNGKQFSRMGITTTTTITGYCYDFHPHALGLIWSNRGSRFSSSLKHFHCYYSNINLSFTLSSKLLDLSENKLPYKR